MKLSILEILKLNAILDSIFVGDVEAVVERILNQIQQVYAQIVVSH